MISDIINLTISKSLEYNITDQSILYCHVAHTSSLHGQFYLCHYYLIYYYLLSAVTHPEILCVKVRTTRGVDLTTTG